MIFNQDECLLLIIDVQEKLLNAVFNPEMMKKKSVILSEAAKILGIPTIITEQYPKGLGSTIQEIDVEAEYFEKTSFNALESVGKIGKKQIIVCGIESHICVYQTVSALLEQGFKVTVVKDAVSSRSEEEYLSALDIMKEIGAEIKTVEMVLFELLKTSKHPNFKEIQNLIK